MSESLLKKINLAHFIGLTIALANGLMKHFLSIGLHTDIELGVELFVVISGLALFGLMLFKRKQLIFYYAIYPLTLILTVTAVVFKNLLLGMIVLFIIGPVLPDNVQTKQNGISISIPSQGFMAPCCTYVVKERKWFIFQKVYPEFSRNEPLDFENLHVDYNDNTIELWKFGNNNEKIKTILKIHKS